MTGSARRRQLPAADTVESRDGRGFTWQSYVELPDAPRQAGQAFSRREETRLLLAARGWQFDADGNPITEMVYDPLGREFFSDGDERLRYRVGPGGEGGGGLEGGQARDRREGV